MEHHSFVTKWMEGSSGGQAFWGERDTRAAGVLRTSSSQDAGRRPLLQVPHPSGEDQLYQKSIDAKRSPLSRRQNAVLTSLPSHHRMPLMITQRYMFMYRCVYL